MPRKHSEAALCSCACGRQQRCRHDGWFGLGRFRVRIWWRDRHHKEALRYVREQHFGGKLVFADADDYFTPEATACFEQFKDEDRDVVWFEVEGRDERGNLTSNADSIRRNMSVFVNEGKEGALRYNSGPVWGKFMDMQLIVKNDIWFPEIETCEDTLFSAKVGYYAQKPFVCPTPLYVYVQRKGRW